MWKQLVDLIPKVFTMTQRLERQEKALEQHSAEIKDLYKMVHNLAYEQQRTRDEVRNQTEREAYERKLLLQEFEIRLLKEKLQLPPQAEEKQDNEEN